MKVLRIPVLAAVAILLSITAQAAQGPPTTALAAQPAPPPVAVPDPPAAPPRTEPVELTLSPFFGLLRTVSGRIGPVEGPFLFDTGGGATILALKTVEALGLTPFGRVTGFRHDGERLDIPRAGPVDLSLGSFRRNGEVGVLDFEKLFGGPTPLAGIVSLETFEGQAITVDLARNRLIVETPESLAQRIQGARELRVRFERQAGGATLDLNVAVEGKHGLQWFELDCGALSTVLVAPHTFAELGIEPPAAGQSKKAEISIAGLGSVPVEVTSKEMIFDGLLNAELFTRYVFTIDLARGKAWAKPNS